MSEFHATVAPQKKLVPLAERIARDVLICADYEAGIRGKDLAAKWGMTQGGLRSILVKNGVTMDSPRDGLRHYWEKISLSPEKVAVILDLHRAGMTVYEIWKVTGHTKVTVNKWLRHHGLMPHIKRSYTILKKVISDPGHQKAIRDAKRHGLNAQKLARSLGYSKTALKALRLDRIARKTQPYADICADMDGGLSMKQAAEKHGVSVNVVGYALVRRRKQARAASATPHTDVG